MKSMESFGLGFGIMAMVVGGALAQAAPAPAANESQQGAKLLQEIRTDAVQVQSAAGKWENLTKSSSANWQEYDRQWNEIAPAAEDMQIKLELLEAMSSSLSATQRSEMDQAKQMVQDIQGRTGQLVSLLNAPGFKTNDARVRIDTRNLAGDAVKIEKAVS